jgi:hypothetical protein
MASPNELVSANVSKYRYALTALSYSARHLPALGDYRREVNSVLGSRREWGSRSAVSLEKAHTLLQLIYQVRSTLSVRRSMSL